MTPLVFLLLGSEDGFSTEWKHGKTPSMINGAFSSIAFLLGALTSILSGYLGMKIATFANARVAVEARKGIAPAFECGERRGSARVGVEGQGQGLRSGG